MSDNRSKILKIALFATGVSGIVAEYVLSTLATYFLGDSVFQWTMIVSIMLFSMGLGSHFSKYVHHRLLETFIGIEFLLSLLTGYVALITYTIAGVSHYTGLLIYLYSVSIGVLIGLEIPLVARLNDSYEELRVNIASVLEKDYYGSLVGGLFFAFIGIPFLGLSYTPFILAFVNFTVACLLFYKLSTFVDELWKTRIKVAGFGVGSLLLAGLIFATPIIKYGEQSRYKDKIIFESQSKYQKIVLTQWKNDYWLFINGNQQLSTLDEVMYHEPMVHSAMGILQSPRHVLVLGGGDGCAVREILKYPSVEKVILVDLDPLMTDLGKTHEVLTTLNHNSLNHSNVTVLNQDGFNYLEESSEFFDAIIADFPDPKSVELSRLYSKEFYQLVNRKLRPHGVFITQAGSPYYATKAFKAIEKTIQSAGFNTLPLHNQILTLGEWGWVIASKELEPERLKQSIRQIKLHVATKWLTNDSFNLITSFGKDIIPIRSKIEVNTISNPVLYRYYDQGNWDLY